MNLLLNLFRFADQEATQQHRILGIIKGVLIIGAWFALAACVLFFFIILIAGGSPEMPRIMSLFVLLLGIIYFIMLFLFASLAEILVNIEQNTKKAAGR